jgi:hypothetical protein
MKRNLLKLTIMLASTFLAQTMKADVLVGPGGAFQPWTASVLGPQSAPTNNGVPYWNNLSGDGATANIGWCLTGGGACAIASPPGAISYYGTATKAAVQNMNFVSTGNPATVTLLQQLTNQVGSAQNSGYNVFGWYTINANGTIASTTPLWNSKTDSLGETATFTPGAPGTKYGLFLENIQGGGTNVEADYFWFMNSSSDYTAGPGQNPVDGLQHFALFSGGGGTYYAGIDDTNFGNEDFNNMVIKLVSAPEPRTLILSGTGLVLLGLCAFRRRTNPALAST